MEKHPRVPFVDLQRQYRAMKEEIDASIFSVLDSSAFIGGTFVAKFEEEFSRYLGVKHAIGVGNGTDALVIALRALGISIGDEVIVPANSFIATSEAVTAAGGIPVFADCGEDYCIDPADIERKITPKTRAIVAVHLYGRPADMQSILEIGRSRGLYVVEDAAQAHGARYKNRMVGTIGDIATFSFYPGKNLGAYGDGGMIVTNDEGLAERSRMLANHGRNKGEKYDHAIEGYNSRLDALQAAILSAKLGHLADWTMMRRKHASTYRQHLSRVAEIVLPEDSDDRESVYHLFVIRTQLRDQLRDFLSDNHIETGIHYPIGLPFLRAYSRFGHHADDYPRTARNQGTILSLPMFAELTDDEISYVSEKITEFINRSY